MPGAMRRMGVYLGLLEDDDYADDYDGPIGRAPERAPMRRDDFSEPRYARQASATALAVAEPESVEAVNYAEEVERPVYQITAVHPRTYNEARTIGEHFRNNTPVIMNLSDMDDADAKRLVDFAAGLTFGLRGRIERVTAKVFLLSPANITVTAQDRAKLVESSFFNQS